MHTPAQDSLISVSHERKRVSYCQSDGEPFLCQINLEINPLDSTLNTCSQTQEISFFSLQMLPLHVFLPLQILFDKIKLSEQFSETTFYRHPTSVSVLKEQKIYKTALIPGAYMRRNYFQTIA